LMPKQGQVIYHFAIGHPIPDPRVSGAADKGVAPGRWRD
jgi:hypothetical protein